MRAPVPAPLLAFPAVALALAAAATPAAASERVTGSVGGYMNLGLGFSDGANTAENFELGIIRDGEIHLKARGSSDNGLQFDVRVELEAFTAVDQIDENWGRVRGSFGEIVIGGADTALNEYGGIGVVKPTGPAFNYYDSDLDSAPGGGIGFIGEDDALGIRYGTPVINGFQAGVSYQPSAETDGLVSADEPGDTGYGFASRGPGSNPKNQWAVGASYEAEFDGGFAFGLGAGYGDADGPGAEERFHIGTELGYAGFTGAFLYNFTNEDGSDQQDVYAAGLQYETGPWTFGGGVAFADGPQESTYATFGGSYALAPGVDAHGIVEIGDETDDGRDTGYGVIAHLNIRF